MASVVGSVVGIHERVELGVCNPTQRPSVWTTKKPLPK